MEDNYNTIYIKTRVCQDFHHNFWLIQKYNRFKMCYFIIKAPIHFQHRINISNMIFLYYLQDVNLTLTHSNEIIPKEVENFIQKVNNLNQKTSTEHEYYILGWQIFETTSEDLHLVRAEQICDDILCLLSFYFADWLEIENIMSDSVNQCVTLSNEEGMFGLIKEGYKNIEGSVDGNNITNRIKLYISFRREQYLLFMKSLKFIRKSHRISKIDTDTALMMLIPAIENCAYKYGLDENKFDDQIPFCQELARALPKTILNSEIFVKPNKNQKIESKNTLIEIIGNVYMTSTFNKNKARYKSFITTFIKDREFDELSEEKKAYYLLLMENLYELRNDYLHSAEIFNCKLDKKWELPLFNQKGNPKQPICDDGIQHPRSFIFESYYHIIDLVRRILGNFFVFLYKNRDNIIDKNKYHENEREKVALDVLNPEIYDEQGGWDYKIIQQKDIHKQDYLGTYKRKNNIK